MKKDQMNSDPNLTKTKVDIGAKCNDLFIRVPNVPNCMECHLNRYCVMLENEKSLTLLSPGERMAHFIKAQHEEELVLALMNMNFGDFYGKKLEFEKENLELMCSVEKNSTETPSFDAILPQMGHKKIAINGTLNEIGKLFGDFFANKKNLKCDHIFDIEDITIATWICASFVLTTIQRKDFYKIIINR